MTTYINWQGGGRPLHTGSLLLFVGENEARVFASFFDGPGSPVGAFTCRNDPRIGGSALDDPLFVGGPVPGRAQLGPASPGLALKRGRFRPAGLFVPVIQTI